MFLFVPHETFPRNIRVSPTSHESLTGLPFLYTHERMDHKTYCKLADLWNDTTKTRPTDHREFCELSQVEQEAFRDGVAAYKVSNSPETPRELLKVKVRNVNYDPRYIEYRPSKGWGLEGSGLSYSSLIALLYDEKISPTVEEYTALVALMGKPYV